MMAVPLIGPKKTVTNLKYEVIILVAFGVVPPKDVRDIAPITFS